MAKTTNKHTGNKKAAAKAETNAEPFGPRPSFAAAVTALEIGESASKAYTPEDDVTLGELRDTLRDRKIALRNSVAPAVTTARNRTGGDYSVEVTTTITTQGQLYLLAIVTRTA